MNHSIIFSVRKSMARTVVAPRYLVTSFVLTLRTRSTFLAYLNA